MGDWGERTIKAELYTAVPATFFIQSPFRASDEPLGSPPILVMQAAQHWECNHWLIANLRALTRKGFRDLLANALMRSCVIEIRDALL